MRERRLVIKISADLTQVVLLEEGEREIPLTPVPEGFSPIKEFVISFDGERVRSSSKYLPLGSKGTPWEEITLHPSLGGRKVGEILKGGVSVE